MTLQEILNNYFNRMVVDLLTTSGDDLSIITIILENSTIEDSSNKAVISYNIDLHMLKNDEYRSTGISKNIIIIDPIGNEQIISTKIIK